MGQFQTKVEQEGTFTELHYCPTGKNHKKTSMLTKMKYRELGCSVVIGSSLKGQLYKKNTHTVLTHIQDLDFFIPLGVQNFNNLRL